MDPNATLKEIRKLVYSNDHVDLSPEDVDRLTELVQALDQWMSKGGFKPLVWIDAQKVEEKLPELPLVSYHRQSTESRLFLAALTCHEVLSRLNQDRLHQVQRAHGGDTYFVSHLCWWIEKADIFLNDYVPFEELCLTDFYDEFVDPHMISDMVVWLTNHTELPMDPGDILRKLVSRLVVEKNKED